MEKNLEKPLKNLTFSLITSILSMVLLIIFIEASNVLVFTLLIVMLLTSLLLHQPGHSCKKDGSKLDCLGWSNFHHETNWSDCFFFG